MTALSVSVRVPALIDVEITLIRVVIVDDHEIVRRGFEDMLSEDMSIEVVYKASSGEQLTKFLRENECDLVLLDIALPDQTGIDILRYIRQRYESLAVLILSSYPEERYALPMIRNGANGYLCKDCDQSELLRAIHRTASGKRYLSPETAELMANELTGEGTEAPHQDLSERELQVFLRLSKGETVSDIATRLNLSVKTVSTYRSRLMDKMDCKSNAELAAYSVRHGLIEDELGVNTGA